MTKDNQPEAKPAETSKAEPTVENLYVFPNYNGTGTQIKVKAKNRIEAMKKADKMFKEGQK